MNGWKGEIVLKGIILCAGKGTRLQPVTFSSPKTLLPIANEPILNHCLRNLAQVGVTEIGVVINPQQTSITEHLTSHHSHLSITILYQTEPMGIAHALCGAKSFIGDDPFILLLGDNLIDGTLTPLLQAFEGMQCAVMLSKVDQPQEYGVAVIKSNKIVHLEEKPPKPKSDLAVVGAYVFGKRVFEAIENIRPSIKGEYEITTAIQWMITNGCSIGYAFTTRFFDVGTPERWLHANQFILRERLGTECEIGADSLLENCTIIGPVKIGSNCMLKNVVIGPYVSVQNNCILTDCSIENSICMEGTIIQSPGIPVVGSLFGRHSRLEGKSDLNHMICVLGDKSTVMVGHPQPFLSKRGIT
jgi:glucose-1-phosphate thymidylyltransferase